MPSLEVLVGLGAGLATFVASVMADEQNTRLRNGTFGAVAGSSMGGIAAIFQAEPRFLIIGVFGSAVGAVLGWFVYLILSCVASTNFGKRLLAYQVGGLSGVRDQLRLDDSVLLQSALSEWAQNFGQMVDQHKRDLYAQDWKPSTNETICLLIRTWLVAVTDAFNLVFGVLAKKPNYRMRVSTIVFGLKNGDPIGAHWVSYSGQLPEQKRNRQFRTPSIAWKVLSQEFQSPYFTTLKTANEKGDNRGDRPYQSFFCFRVNESVVLVVDWPGDLKEDDAYIKIARELFQAKVIPAIREVLEHYPQSVQKELGFEVLSAASPSHVRPAPPARQMN